MRNNYLPKNIRTAAILTNAYVACTTIADAQEYNQLELLLDYTKGSLTSLEVKVETSEDNSDFYQETNVAVSGGTSTVTVNEYTYTGATAKYKISIPISAGFVKVSVKGTGTLTSSSLVVDAILHAA